MTRSSGRKDSVDLSSYTHLFFSVYSARKLSLFSMKSLYLEIFILPRYSPIVSDSVWCHKSDVTFNTHYAIDISNYKDLELKDFNIKVDVFSKSLLHSQRIGTVVLPLINCEIFRRTVPPILFFYKHTDVFLVDPSKDKRVGRINVSCVFGRYDDAQIIDPTVTFRLIQLKTNGSGLEMLGIPSRRSRKISDIYSSGSSGFGSFNGGRGSLSPRVKSDALFKSRTPSRIVSESLSLDLSPISMRNPEFATRLSRSSKELINIVPARNISTTRNFSSREINEMFGRDKDTEDKIDKVIKDGLRNRFNILTSDYMPGIRNTTRERSVGSIRSAFGYTSPSNENYKLSNELGLSKVESNVRKSPPLEEMFDIMDISGDLDLDELSESSSYEESDQPRLVVNRK